LKFLSQRTAHTCLALAAAALLAMGCDPDDGVNADLGPSSGKAGEAKKIESNDEEDDFEPVVSEDVTGGQTDTGEGADGTGECANDGDPCEDGDPCTEGDACIFGLCIPGTKVVSPECGGYACSLSGDAGDVVICSMYLAAATETSEKVSGLQFQLEWDATEVSLVDIRDTKCIVPTDETTCSEASLIGGTLYPSGHMVTVAPSTPESWVDKIAVVLISLSFAPLNESYLDANGDVVGDPQVMDFAFELARDISAESPYLVGPTDIGASSAMAATLTCEDQEGLLVCGP
jgi:hypothetical protein